MNWSNFNTYDLGHRSAFETLNNQLFERYVRRTYGNKVVKLRPINGSGGDGGIEAYAELSSKDIIAIQSKWFLQSLDDSEIVQIKNSILTAKKVRPQIKEYIICIPHNVNSVKIGRGKKLTKNHEENKINALVDEIYKIHPDLKLTWWFDNELLTELQQTDNEAARRYWFEKEVISLSFLKEKFDLQKENQWLKERYVPDLHAAGIIEKEYNKLIFSEQYRKTIAGTLQEKIDKISHCQQLINDFLSTNEYPESIKIGLESIDKNFSEFNLTLAALQDAATKGNDFFQVDNTQEFEIWPTTIDLEKKTPTHKQKPILQKLIQSLRDIHIYKLPQYILDVNAEFTQLIKLIKGDSGTGKTHGLANCVEKHLGKNLPAIIIPAKSTPCGNWTEILTFALELQGWNKEEIFSALESIAVSHDASLTRKLPPGAELEMENAKVLLCIDGLEEATSKETDWCSRMAETVLISKKYPRLRFLFSARNYFKDGCIDYDNGIFKQVTLPRNGDVPVSSVAENYLKTYGINLPDLTLIKGLDSLFALRLFCEEYKGQTIATDDMLVTATMELLNLKVERINREFIASLNERKGVTQQPMFDALLLIAESFYSKAEIEHSELRAALLKKVADVLSGTEVDILLDFFVQHGILIRTTRRDDSLVLAKSKSFYRITYQSIIEHILSEKIYNDIKEQQISVIPDILHGGIAEPSDIPREYDPWETAPNQQIIQSILNRLFVEAGNLFGEDDFLIKGFSPEKVIEMQMEVLRSAPYEKAISYKDKVDALFFGGPESQYLVLKHLILPSARSAECAFGSEYIHNILLGQPSAFERDKLWSGLDGFEQTNDEAKSYNNNLSDIFDEYDGATIGLLGFENHNETPLLYAWGLTNISQALRSSLRGALTSWAIKRPGEFLKLLDKVFFCNDPQLQEDLASVALGISGVLSDKEQLRLLANWAIENIFDKKNIHRNVIVRQGFRAVVEKAGLMKAITPAVVQNARPAPLADIELIDLTAKVLSKPGDESYPIVHDLAWYVIKDAYHNFLEHPSGFSGGKEDNDCPEAKALLDIYRKKYRIDDIYSHSWAMAAAISYINGTLGLTRKKGNSFTTQSHGGKSAVFTYEEKYTWLAVHYLQGYLSDYVPMDKDGEREWISDYLQITDIPNPGENIPILDIINKKKRKSENWIIKENLASTIDLTTDIEENIKKWVREEPGVDFAKWVKFDDTDFPEFGNIKHWIALYNHTKLLDASKAGSSSLNAYGCLIKESEFEKLKNIIATKPQSLHFVSHLSGLHASPDTATYSNPSDIVWMDWVEEYSNSEKINFKEGETDLFYTITDLTQGTHAGEKHYMIPSKLVRKIIGIRSFSNPEFMDEGGKPIAFIHKKSEGAFKDSQEIVLVDKELLYTGLKEKGLKICWFVEVFKKKNPLNEALKEYAHDQKTRMYLVWEKADEIKSIKFWDAYFSNQLDKEES